MKMNRLRYTAAGGLGIWDSVDKPGMESWLPKLKELLRSNAHGIVESDILDLAETDDPDLAAITAVCDKIVARGNPTLVDPNWERILLSGPGSEFLHYEEPDDPVVKFGVKEFLLPKDSSYQLLEAAKDLLDLPWSDGRPAPQQKLSADLRALCSGEEDTLYSGLMSALGPGVAGAVQRQPLISDLVDDDVAEGLAGNRVDFALQLSRVRWVIEVDGVQHEEAGERAKDSWRDQTLCDGGWKVLRVPTGTVRSDLNGWLRQTWADAGNEERPSLDLGITRRSVEAALEESQIHRAAWHLLLRPLAVQRCLRGLLLLYRYGALDATRPQRILVVEEDMPAVVDAFKMLRELWKLTFSLQPDMGVGPPEFLLDVMGEQELQDAGLNVRYVDRPEGDYDVVISNSLLLGEGYPGPLLTQVAPELADRALRIRRGAGRRNERRLQRSKSFHYRLGVNFDIQERALRRLLQIVFRNRCFRDGQEKSIKRLLRGDPSIVLLPTGGGKSLVYQFVGMLLPGMTVIVDPIISLMDDQIHNLKRMGIDRVEGISGQQVAKRRVEGLRRMAGGKLSYVFISPERLQSDYFRGELQQVKALVPISLVVLDEAHCLSEWGHDFRSAYLYLPLNLQRYCMDKDSGACPTLAALTGTASFAVLEDIQVELEIDDEDAIIRPESFDRKELNFDVRRVPSRSRPAELKQVREMMPERWRFISEEFYRSKRGDTTNCGLVFCPHVNGKLGVLDVAAGLGHAYYYAGRAPRRFNGDWNAYKQEMQRQFTKNEIQELVTTKSFGMGIDKGNIRYTVHYVMPTSVEQFYQEAGRAGRNGIKDYALCTVIYSHDRWDEAIEILDESDHQKAMRRLTEMPRDSRGDVLENSWFLLNSYKGRKEEKRSAFELWRDWLAGEVGSSLRTVPIPFGQDRAVREKCIYRLAILGIVDDCTVDWRTQTFSVTVRDVDADEVQASLSKYLTRYKFPVYVDKQLERVCGSDSSEMVEQAVGVLVDFIYDEVVMKRKRAIRTMAELCNDFEDSDDFRSRILAYLEESEFSKLLNTWRNRSFADIGLEAVRGVLAGSDAKDQLRRLIGAVRRMLDDDPGNVALLYLSVGTRAVSPWESDRSVVDETGALLAAARAEKLYADALQFELLQDIVRWRPGMESSLAHHMVSAEDGLHFARQLLTLGRLFGDGVRLVALGVIASNVVETVTGVSGSYDLQLSGGQDDARGE